mgnify:CR=1 FL=1
MTVERGIGFHIGLGMVLLLGGAGSALAATLTVCPSGCSHTTIQGAVSAAFPGDTIQILSSTHTEGDIFLTKDITVEGFGAALTIVQAHASPGVATVPVFIVTGGSDVVIRSLVNRHGDGNNGGGVYIQDGTLTLEDVNVMHNTASSGGGVFVSATATLRTSGATINYNTADGGGGGVEV